jgi:hypothetical protein
MVFGICATRVIGFTVTFAKDVIVASQRGEKASNLGAVNEDVDGSRVDATTGKEKTA